MSQSKASHKDIQVKGRNFRLTKFTPEVGCYWAFKLFGSMASGGINLSLDAVAGKIEEFTKMDRVQFQEFQRDCLGCVSELLDGGPAPLLQPNGFFGVKDVDGPLAFVLTVQSFAFSIADFFAPELLEALMGMVQEGIQKGEQAVTTNSQNSSTSPSTPDTGNNTNYGTEPTPSPTGSV